MAHKTTYTAVVEIETSAAIRTEAVKAALMVALKQFEGFDVVTTISVRSVEVHEEQG